MGKTANEWSGIKEIPDNCWELQKQLVGDARIVFDVGAHHGRVVGRYLEMFPNAIVYAFEPEERNFQNMLKRLPKLRGKGERAKPFNRAVLDSDGHVRLHLATINVAHSVFESSSYVPSPVQTVVVLAVTIDRFCQDRNIEHIDVLKIDAEGADLLVLRGGERMLSENRIGLIYCEMVYYPYYKGVCEAWQIGAFLDKHGWGIHSLWGKTLPGHRFLGGDAIFMNRGKLATLPKSKR